MGTGFFAIIYKQRNKGALWRVKKIKRENNEFPSAVEPPHIHIQHTEPPYHTDVHPHAHTHSHASIHTGSHSGIPPHWHPHSHTSIPRLSHSPKRAYIHTHKTAHQHPPGQHSFTLAHTPKRARRTKEVEEKCYP